MGQAPPRGGVGVADLEGVLLYAPPDALLLLLPEDDHGLHRHPPALSVGPLPLLDGVELLDAVGSASPSVHCCTIGGRGQWVVVVEWVSFSALLHYRGLWAVGLL